MNRYTKKICPLASRLSTSFEVTETHKDRSATYDFLLVIHSNHGPISFHFRDEWQFRPKIANFSHLRLFIAPIEGIPLGIL